MVLLIYYVNINYSRNHYIFLICLQFVDLGSSATLHFADGAGREKNLDEGKRYIDLARQISCPYIRVFPTIFQKTRTGMQQWTVLLKD